MKTVRARQLAGLQLSTPRGWLSVGHDAAVLWDSPTDVIKDSDALTVLHEWKPGGQTSVVIPEKYTPRSRLFVQRRSDGGWFLVRPYPGEPNGRLFTAEGQPAAQFALGHPVSQAQMTPDGHLWVGYVDEGIFSNTEPARAGLNCFDSEGKRIFRFDQLAERYDLPHMDQCCCLNVPSEREAWTYYYNSFSFVKLKNMGFDRSWQVPVQGSRAVAVMDDHALFVGTYEDPLRVSLVSLRSLEVEAVTLLDDHDQPLAFNRAYGRGANLYFETDDSVYVVDLNAL